MEMNKILAAVLVAGIVASLSGFVSGKLYGHHGEHGTEAYPIAAAEASPANAEPEKVVPLADLLASADPAKGEKISKVCGSCHTFNAGGSNGVGPNLHGVIGRAHASAPGYAYSDAMAATKGKTWSAETLNEFLSGPQAFVPGTKMTFAGLKKAEDRAALIKWLETQK